MFVKLRHGCEGCTPLVGSVFEVQGERGNPLGENTVLCRDECGGQTWVPRVCLEVLAAYDFWDDVMVLAP